MTSTGSQNTSRAIVLDSRLLLADGGGTLETDAEVNVLAVRDTALDATTPVGRSAETAVRTADERVVVLGARDLRPAEARADLEGLSGRNAEHGVGKLCLELVKDRLAEARGNIANDTGDRSTD